LKHPSLKHLSPLGEVEISNPFLAFVLPEKLRKNKDLITQVYRNTDELISHFDIYATLLEIATVSFCLV
jgi:hypothetical protein